MAIFHMCSVVPISLQYEVFLYGRHLFSMQIQNDHAIKAVINMLTLEQGIKNKSLSQCCML